MNAKKLIKELQRLPESAPVFHLWDGEARTEINHVWLSRDGKIITADDHQRCYSTETRPKGAPTENEDANWGTSKIKGSHK